MQFRCQIDFWSLRVSWPGCWDLDISFRSRFCLWWLFCNLLRAGWFLGLLHKSQFDVLLWPLVYYFLFNFVPIVNFSTNFGHFGALLVAGWSDPAAEQPLFQPQVVEVRSPLPFAAVFVAQLRTCLRSCCAARALFRLLQFWIFSLGVSIFARGQQILPQLRCTDPSSQKVAT